MNDKPNPRDWTLVSMLRTTAHEIAKFPDAHPDTANLMREAADWIAARLDADSPISGTLDSAGTGRPEE